MEGPSNGGLLYHEVQEAKLCAVHCVNTILQGPFFSEVVLAALASDLDQKERGGGGGGGGVGIYHYFLLYICIFGDISGNGKLPERRVAYIRKFRALRAIARRFGIEVWIFFVQIFNCCASD
ncbi:hypothetical protein KFK09_025728 [Dendrobium nobile]|uniref:ubiquitinyl hydrolase 1 n=1 Tax=Dendrobium nobile TaxID=94219 RepID=A0A8T3A5Q9_DENNO|nr:hypothetical protein KFK09_025728 [Dendrobium nobile]